MAKLVDSIKSDPFKGLAAIAAAVGLALTPLALRQLAPMLDDDPVKGFALAGAVFAVATTPLAYAVLGRIDWFQARRGRQFQRPEFFSIVCGLMLTMGIPAIFAALVVKSDKFDKNRYEFDPNKIPTVLEQGRQYKTAEEMNQAIRDEMNRLAEARKNLVNDVKKLDDAMVGLMAAVKTGGSPQVAKSMPEVLQRLAALHGAVGLDGPHQLLDLTAQSAELKALMAAAPAVPAVVVASAGSPVAPAPAAAAPGPLPKAVAEAELATVPEPQRKLAAMLPLADLPPGWTVGKSGDKHLETFNAENLFEKIDGRAESFIQYDVKGMAYTYFTPIGDESNEVQLYIFELANPLKALGKFGSEKPEGVTSIPVGTEGYTAAGSTLFHADRYYTQIVSTKDDPKFSEFALAIAKQVASKQTTAPATAAGGAKFSSPDTLFKLLPEKPDRQPPKYVAQDVFGYSFLSDVFMADYKDGGTGWQGFLRPYPTPADAEKVFQNYIDTVKKDGAKLATSKVDGADAFVVSDNIGLVDVVFRKGNVIGGANGSTDRAKAEAFAKTLLKGLPASLPPLESDAPGSKKDQPKAKTEGGEGY